VHRTPETPYKNPYPEFMYICRFCRDFELNFMEKDVQYNEIVYLRCKLIGGGEDRHVETSFGNWIKRRRKALDMTQEELGKKVGCSTSAIFKIEADERRPSRQLAELLAECLEIPADQRTLFLKVARQEKSPDSLEISPADPARAGAATPAPDPVIRQSNLPAFPTQFVGREFEISIVANHLRDPSCRLLTLTGPGGVGKTRLAVEVAGKLESVFPDGIFFLPMASVNLSEAIIPAFANGLGVVFSGPADPIIQVINALRNKKVLLVIDNMEHLTGGSIVLGEILQQAPNVKMLLTSREQMHLQWEWIFDVQGLPVPEEATAEALMTNSAAVLFLQRARQTGQSYTLSTDEANALVQICKFVDGLPLAIELAASWVRIMSFREIAQELERNTGLLETDLRDIPARHRSMKVVFDHSWAFLTNEEQTVLMQLSVFSGGFIRKAAEAVAGVSLLLLSSLVSKSLLRYSKKADRYDFHELVRQYVIARLHEQPALEQSAHTRFAEYYAEWLSDLEMPLKSTQQSEVSRRIRAEKANWSAAWNWSVGQQRLELLDRMEPCLYWFNEIHGENAEAMSLIAFAVSALRAAGAPAVLTTDSQKASMARLIDALGWFEFRTGNIERGVALFAESLALAETTAEPDHEVLYYIYVNWGYMSLVTGDFEAAARLTQTSLEHARAFDGQWHAAISVNILGIVEYQRGNLEEAYHQLADSLKMWRTVGDLRGLTFCMLYLSSAALALGKIEAAKTVLLESNAIAEKKMDHWAHAFGLDLMGKVSMLEGEFETARNQFQHSLALSEEIGDKLAGTQTRIHLGEALASLGEDEAAKRLFHQAYRSAQQAKWAPTILEALVAFVALDEEIPPETRLEVTLFVLSHPAVSPTLQQKSEQLRLRLSSSLTGQQLAAAQQQVTGSVTEWWDRLAPHFSQSFPV
jgi:predicted ATPase/transcriptional regulator with XRE-family HTH domain